MIPNGSNWCEWHQIELNGTEWCQMLPNDAEWHQFVPNSTKWCQMVLNGAEQCRMVPNGAEWCRIVNSLYFRTINTIQNTDYKNSKSTNVHEMLKMMVQGLSQKTKSLIKGTLP